MTAPATAPATPDRLDQIMHKLARVGDDQRYLDVDRYDVNWLTQEVQRLRAGIASLAEFVAEEKACAEKDARAAGEANDGYWLAQCEGRRDIALVTAARIAHLQEDTTR